MSTRKTYPITQEWHFRQAGQSRSEFLATAHFPTNVHLDLLSHGLIPDPYIGKNEQAVQWVGLQAWDYRTEFATPDALSENVVLVFEGLDTYATVRLNGSIILKTENMFIPERVSVKELLQTDEPNVLEIIFKSTYLVGKKLVEEHPDHYWACWNGDPSRLAVRKAQYHYGWDWGPALLTCGPWRPISLETYHARISDLSFRTSVSKSLQSAEISLNVEIEGDADTVVFDISYEGTMVAREMVNVHNGIAICTLRAQNVKLWYPHTYGDQPLYLAKATLLRGDQQLDVLQKRFAFRKVEVIQHRLENAPGTSFFFKVNDISTFCGGSNWIPADMFTPRMTLQKYHDWVKMAVDCNQIMLRVWGGGIFEEQAFYNTCDEMGVLIWQDFLFGCGNYPAHDKFLDLVRREATANVKRIRHHPSIVIFAGNNEDYQFCESENLDYDPHNHEPNSWLSTNFPARYVYEKVLADVTSSLVPDTYYHFSSPYGGICTADPTVGDIHQWNIWHGSQRPYQDFPSLTGRFISEFGMEALPTVDTIDSFLPRGAKDSDRYASSATLDFHNKAAGHTRRLAMYMDENLRYDFEPLEQYIYYTQLMQAECIATAYRSAKRKWKGPGHEECSGVLVWQLNDCWPGTSWAVVDYYLRPKLAYYAIKRELQQITVGLQRNLYGDDTTLRDEPTVEMWAVNFSLRMRDAYVKIYRHSLTTNQRTLMFAPLQRYSLSPNRSTELMVFRLPSYDSEEASQTVIAAYLHDPSGEIIARAINWPEPLKWVHAQKPNKIHARLIGKEDEERDEPHAILISADVCIKCLQLEIRREGNEPVVVFADTGFDVVPGEEVRVGVRGMRWGEEKNLVFKYMGM